MIRTVSSSTTRRYAALLSSRPYHHPRASWCIRSSSSPKTRLLQKNALSTTTSATSSCNNNSSTRRSETTTTTTTREEETDVLIVGGGVVGCALARLLRQRMPHLDVTLLERAASPMRIPSSSPPSSTTKSSSSNDDNENIIPHPRSYALSPASFRVLGQHRIFGRNEASPPDSFNDSDDDDPSSLTTLLQGRCGVYDSMQIWEADQPASLVLSAQDLAAEDDAVVDDNDKSVIDSSYLGAVVEDAVLQECLWSQLSLLQQEKESSSSSQLLKCYTNTTVSHVELPDTPQSGPVTVGLKPSSSSSSPPPTIMDENKTSGAGQQQDDNDNNNDTRRPLTIRAKLLVAADGANSQIRQLVGITRTNVHDYGQTALTFTVELEADQQSMMKRRAFQRFLPTGPLALLPTFSPNHAIVVWSTTPSTAQQWKNCSDPNLLVQHLNQLLQAGPERLKSLFPGSHNNTTSSSPSLMSNLGYGVDKLLETVQYGSAMAVQELLMTAENSRTAPFCAPPTLVDIASPKFTFPLSSQTASSFTDNKSSRCALVGDAAHTVHPLAGQGLNLGLQDVANLVDVVQKAYDAGMDVSTFLSQYERSRQTQVHLTVAGIHAIQQVFGVQNVWAKHVKSLGMNVIQTVAPLRRAMVQAACQGVATPQ